MGVLFVAVLNGVRGVWLWQREPFLSPLPFGAPLPYLIGGALLWCALWGAAALGLWRLASWARWFTLVVVIAYNAQRWLDRLLFEISEFARQMWPWHAMVSAVGIALTWLILWRPNARSSFNRTNRSDHV